MFGWNLSEQDASQFVGVLLHDAVRDYVFDMLNEADFCHFSEFGGLVADIEAQADRITSQIDFAVDCQSHIEGATCEHEFLALVEGRWLCKIADVVQVEEGSTDLQLCDLLEIESVLVGGFESGSD